MAVNLFQKHEEDQWVADGQPAFGVIPGGVLDVAPEPAPIFLFRGNAAWGVEHIEARHGPWLGRLGMTVPEVVWLKCQQTGALWSTDDEHKCNLMLTLSPAALMVLRYHRTQKHYRVVTLYNRTRAVDGMHLGRYVPLGEQPKQPQFVLRQRQPPVVVVTRGRRAANNGGG